MLGEAVIIDEFSLIHSQCPTAQDAQHLRVWGKRRGRPGLSSWGWGPGRGLEKAVERGHSAVRPRPSATHTRSPSC